MKHSSPTEVHALRSGKIKVSQSSASEIRRSVGVQLSDLKLVEKVFHKLNSEGRISSKGDIQLTESRRSRSKAASSVSKGLESDKPPSRQ